MRPVLATGVLVVAMAGCAGSTGGGQLPPGRSPRATRPAPVRTVIRDSRVIAAGRTAVVTASHGIVLRLRVSRPAVSRSRLSPSYGYPPARGYYLTFQVVIANTGRQRVDLGPGDFVVHTNRQAHVTSYDGNSPYSGASRQLDNTELDPGQQVSAPLTFDVSVTHGRLAFVPDRSPAVVWRF